MIFRTGLSGEWLLTEGPYDPRYGIVDCHTEYIPPVLHPASRVSEEVGLEYRGVLEVTEHSVLDGWSHNGLLGISSARRGIARVHIRISSFRGEVLNGEIADEKPEENEEPEK